MSKKKMLMRKFGSAAIVNNTFIGGVASVINTHALLAAKLSNYPGGGTFDEANIQNFTIVGDDIECYIGADYKFGDFFLNNYTNLTYYRDVGGKAISNADALSGSMFLGCENLEEVYLPNMINIYGTNTNWTFAGIFPKWRSLYIPNVVNFGSTVGNNGDVFRTNFVNSIKIYAHPSMQTINAGGVEGDLALFDSLGNNSVNYVLNSTPPSAITNLSIGTIYATALQLNFTAPSSLNTIDFYEVWVNGKYNNKGNASGLFAIGLTPITTYTIEVKPVDIYYNKSTSNIITQATSNGDTLDYVINEHLLSYYKMQNDVLDSWGANNGTATAITYASGLVGQTAVFNGTSSFVSIPDNNAFSFTDGVTDKPFSISMIANFTATGDRWLINKRSGTSVGNQEWQLIYYLGKLEIYFFNHNTTGYIFKSYSFTPVLGQNYKIQVAYTGSGFHTGLSIFIDGISVGTSSMSGVYERMINTTSPVVIGKAGWGGFFFNGKLDEVSIFNKALTAAELSDINAKLNSGQSLI